MPMSARRRRPPILDRMSGSFAQIAARAVLGLLHLLGAPPPSNIARMAHDL